MSPGRVPNHVVREKGGMSYWVDGSGLWHYIDSSAVYNCRVTSTNLINATWDEINSIKREGAHATC
jgi:hypothetical protein